MQNLSNRTQSSSVDPDCANAWARYYTYGASKFPHETMQKHAAFASSFLSLVKGVAWSPPGFPQGPSMRALAVDYSLAGPKGVFRMIETTKGPLIVMEPDGSLKPPGVWRQPEALRRARDYCYCPIEEHLGLFEMIWKHAYHFDNDPDDIAFMEARTGRPEATAPELNHDLLSHGLVFSSDYQVWARVAPPKG